MKTSNRYASFLLRLWRREPAGDGDMDSWQGEVEHIQSGKVLLLNQLNNLPSLLQQIANKDRSNTSEETKNE